MTFLLDSLLLPCFFLLGAMVLTACSTAFLRLGKFKSKELLRSEQAPLFFFLPVLRKFFPKQEWENLYFSISISKHIFQLGFAVTAFCYVISKSSHLQTDWSYLLKVGSSIVAISLIVDFLIRLLANVWS